MVEAAPPAPFVMPEPDLLLEFLIVALDAPTQFGDVDQITVGDFCRKRREPVFDRFFLALRPLDQQPFFRPALAALEVAPCGTNAHARKAGGQVPGSTFPPCDRAPSALGQAERELLDRDRLMLGVAPQELGWSSAARPGLGRQRLLAGGPHGGVRLNASNVTQLQCCDVRPQ